MANDGRIGIEEAGVSNAIQNLESCKTALVNWRDEMMNLKTQVVSEWLGDAAGVFDESYNKLDVNMSTMEDAINAFTLWATETQQMYQQLDQAQSNSMANI